MSLEENKQPQDAESELQPTAVEAAPPSKKPILSIKEIVIFACLGALMYVLKLAMQVLPNIHLVGVFLIAETFVYRKKALYPLYIYVLLEGIFGGFSVWWIPYLYVWTVLWAMTMLIPERLPDKWQPIVFALTGALHGLMFGALNAPVWAIAYGMNFKAMLAWIGAGFSFDLLHAGGNFAGGLILCYPMALLFKRFGR